MTTTRKTHSSVRKVLVWYWDCSECFQQSGYLRRGKVLASEGRDKHNSMLHEGTHVAKLRQRTLRIDDK